LSKVILNELVIKDVKFMQAIGKWENICCVGFFLSNSKQIPSEEAFMITLICILIS